VLKQILLKCAQVNVKLRIILNFDMKQLVYDTVFIPGKSALWEWF
jgi:hypothetical protein